MDEYLNVLNFVLGSSGGVTPEGKKAITSLDEVDVTEFATAQVEDANIIAENIKKDVNILGVTGSFAGAWSWAGENPEVMNTYTEKIYLKDTDFATWTPSSASATLILANSDKKTLTPSDLNGYDCVVEGKIQVVLFYTDGAQKAQVYNVLYQRSGCYYKGPQSLSELQTGNYTSAKALQDAGAVGLIYRDTSNNEVFGYNTQQGFFVQGNVLTFLGSNCTVSRPAIYVRCNSNYFSETEAAYVDQDRSYIEAEVTVYRVKQGTSIQGHTVDALKGIYDNGIVN